MIGLRQYKSIDAEKIAEWVKDEDAFLKWGGKLFCEYPITARIIDEKYRANNGGCEEPDNFYPWMAFDENGVFGHFIMRYMHGDNKFLRFGWVVVDDRVRGRGYGTQMLRLGLKYAFEILGVDIVTLGVFENNDLAHNCYKKVGFKDRETVNKEPWNVIEMEIRREDWERDNRS